MFDKIMVCLDGSTLADQIIPYVKPIAKNFNSKVLFLQVVSMPTQPTVVAGPGIDPVPVPVPTMPTSEQLNKQLADAANQLEISAAPLRDEGIDVKCEVPLVANNIAEAIINHALDNDINMIALATHGRGGIKRMVFGSIADHVLRHCSIPMLVITPKEEENAK